MRITHVTLRYPPASGGVEDYVQNIVERLRAAGDDVNLETTTLRTHHPALFLDEPLNDPPYVHRNPVHTFRRFAYPIPTTLRSRLTTHPSQLIHAHGFWYAPADIAARVAHRRRIPIVVNPYFAPRTKPIWKLYRFLRGNRTLALADAIVVISPEEESALRAAEFPPRRIELIPPGIDLAEYAPGRPNPFLEQGLGNKRILLFAGRIARAKGVDLLLEAFARILREYRDVHLAIAGEDFGERATFSRQAQALSIHTNVTWLGKLPRSELLAAYQHAEVFVFPSRYEAFGIAPLEAQAAGCPVVATDAASLPFVVRHGTTGFLTPPEDPEAMAAAVLRLLRDRALATRLGQAGRARAHREFTWDQSVQKLQQLYTDLL
jgi:glycosyltransferase involved in cell wall biosynthesis